MGSPLTLTSAQGRITDVYFLPEAKANGTNTAVTDVALVKFNKEHVSSSEFDKITLEGRLVFVSGNNIAGLANKVAVNTYTHFVDSDSHQELTKKVFFPINSEKHALFTEAFRQQYRNGFVQDSPKAKDCPIPAPKANDCCTIL